MLIRSSIRETYRLRHAYKRSILMIKRFRFGISTTLPLAPAHIRPVRVTRSTPVGELASRYTYTVQWFADIDALAAYKAWEGERIDAATVIIAEEVIQRGGEWLERRWTEGTSKWKHVALARRAQGLSQSEFSNAWHGHAGKATTKSVASAPIPEAARGLAYVQNHPLPGINWQFDAITEVWFEDLHSMQPRIEWFRDNIVTDDLFGEMIFLAVMEEVLEPVALT